ncbi:hypothetical protein P691DRAFT_611075, partial [Macrolepiota fuliginosa MF-IS2]
HLEHELQQRIQSLEEEEELDGAITVAGLLAFASHEAEQICTTQWLLHHQYLAWQDLLPNPHLGIPWQILYEGQNDWA